MTTWVPVLGDYEFDDDTVIFKGRSTSYDSDQQGQPVERPEIGNALSNERFGGGEICASIIFSEIRDAACEVMLYYDLTTKAFVTAGLGGSGYLASVRHFDGSSKWTVHGGAGIRTHLEADRNYRLRVRVRGSRVTVTIDDIDILVVDLPAPLPQGQAGLWCMSRATITISHFKVIAQRPRAFVVMEYSERYNELYEDVIKPVCQHEGLEVIRGDEEFGPGVIIADVARRIVEAKIIIAEISPTNANVYYELGYAHALGKPSILIAERSTKLPFDVSPFRTLFYENSINGKAKIEDGLRKHVQAILTAPGAADLAKTGG